LGKKERRKRGEKRKKKSHYRFSVSSLLSLSHLDPRALLLVSAIFKGKRFFVSSTRSDASWRKRALFLQQINRGKRGFIPPSFSQMLQNKHVLK